MSGESRLDRLAYSLIVKESSRRWMEARVIGSASEMKPGLDPVEWMEVPPAAQAASTRARSAGSMLPGWWNSPRVVTMFAPDDSSVQTSSRLQAAGM